MTAFREEASAFRRAKERQVREARQMAAFFLVSGIDLEAALKTTGEERRAILMRLARLIERERLKGMRRHWSYDLNLHIALSQAYDRLKGEAAPKVRKQRPARRRSMPTGARKRRRLQAPPDHKAHPR